MNLTELEERLKGHAQITKSIIPTPFNLNFELNKLEEKNMNKFKNVTWLKRLATTAAVLAVCAVTVVSAGALTGYFKDVKNFSGAIVGTEYINATNDVQMNVLDANDEYITLDINFVNPSEAPFAFIQELAVTEYIVLDQNNNEVFAVNSDAENCSTAIIEADGTLIKLPTKYLNNEETYTLKINTIYGLAKAEQPLKITGDWKCEFKR